MRSGWIFDVFNYQYQETVPVYQYHVAQDDGWRFHFTTDQNYDNRWTKDNICFYAYVGVTVIAIISFFRNIFFKQLNISIK